jgi:hypothetical protein
VDEDTDEWRMNQAEDMLMAASDTETLTNHNGIRQYMKAVVKFREALLVVAHIARGQPGRGPELLSICHTNTAGGGHRNVFVEDGYVVLATRHHKGYKATLNVRIIHRYQPREVITINLEGE